MLFNWSSEVAGIVPDFGFFEAARDPARGGVEPRVKRFGQNRQRRITDARYGRLDGRGEPLGTVVWKFAWLAAAEQVDSDRAQLGLEPAPRPVRARDLASNSDGSAGVRLSAGRIVDRSSMGRVGLRSS